MNKSLKYKKIRPQQKNLHFLGGARDQMIIVCCIYHYSPECIFQTQLELHNPTLGQCILQKAKGLIILGLIIQSISMNFNYRNYVKRYKYQPFCWPPDLSLAELHARCSEPGPINEDGVECPCCHIKSKKKLRQWWKGDIEKDLANVSTAIPGYFQLIKYYSCFAFLVLLINSLYPIYATFYACQNFDPKQENCLEVGALYYLQFNSLIELLRQYGRQDMIDILMILQTAVFYILLIANYFSIVFITFMNETAKRELREQAQSESSRCLVFYNISKQEVGDFRKFLKEFNENEININVVASMELYEIKKYYDYFLKRNKIYYYLLSMEVSAENPLKVKNLNKQLKQSHQIVLEEKERFDKFSRKVLVLFEDVETRKQVHKKFRLTYFQKWGYGVQSLMNQFGIKKFDNQNIRILTYEIGIGSDVLWQNLGEQLGVKMAIRIKTFFVAIIFIVLCYLVLYYPMVFSLKTHIKVETKRSVHLNTFEKILPNLTAFALVGLSIYFRVYMDRLSEQRNPKDQLEKARFVLITCLTFHILFYIIIPTLFFMIPGEIGETVKLYVISEQARTFIVIQVIIVLVDLPYRIWKEKKVKALSDQRVAFKNNQLMLHKIVEVRDYPLQIRLQILFRIWSLVLFYSFFIPYIVFYIILALFIIFWIEKRNLYKHYIIRRKVSIKLQSDTLMYFVNFFCVYLCFIYCYNVKQNATKIIVAVVLTLVGLVANIVYWLILNKAEQKGNQIISENKKNNQPLLRRPSSLKIAQDFKLDYQKFLDLIQNDKLDEEITLYLNKVKQYQDERSRRKTNMSIELSQIENKMQLQQESDETISEHQQVNVG